MTEVRSQAEARNRRRARRRVVLLALAAVASAVAWVVLAWDNFGTVRTAELYRSGQMGHRSLTRAIRDRQIRTVLNLRGSHPESTWYRAERAATLAGGAAQVDLALSSCEWMSRAQARALLEVLDAAERPLLVHCFHGSERTGMVAAFAELLRPGSTLADADAQFSMRHLYFGVGDGVVTRRHLDAYAGWLRDRATPHTPDRLRRWLAAEYAPGTPCRDSWSHDPYPLVVTTRPPARLAARGGR